MNRETSSDKRNVFQLILDQSDSTQLKNIVTYAVNNPSFAPRLCYTCTSDEFLSEIKNQMLFKQIPGIGDHAIDQIIAICRDPQKNESIMVTDEPQQNQTSEPLVDLILRSSTSERLYNRFRLIKSDETFRHLRSISSAEFLASVTVQEKFLRVPGMGRKSIDELRTVLEADRQEMPGAGPPQSFLSHIESEPLVDVVLRYPTSVRLRNVARAIKTKERFMLLRHITSSEFLSNFEYQQKFLMVPTAGKKCLEELRTLASSQMRTPSINSTSDITAATGNEQSVQGESNARVVSLPELQTASVRLRNAIRLELREINNSAIHNFTVSEYVRDREVRRQFLNLKNMGRKASEELTLLCKQILERASKDTLLSKELTQKFSVGATLLDLLSEGERLLLEDSSESIISTLDAVKTVDWIASNFEATVFGDASLASWVPFYLRDSIIAHAGQPTGRIHSPDLFIEAVRSRLKPREQLVIEQRFGVGSNRISTLEEVGSQLNVTRERIRQIEKKALLRIRNDSPFRAVVRHFISVSEGPIADLFFGTNHYVGDEARVSGVYSLALGVCFDSNEEYLHRLYTRIGKVWYRYLGDDIVRSIIDDIKKLLQSDAEFFYIGSILNKHSVTTEAITACINDIDSQCFAQGNYLFRGVAGAKRKRTADILEFFSSSLANRQFTLLELLAYFRLHLNDQVSNARLIGMVLHELKGHTLNLKYYGWINLRLLGHNTHSENFVLREALSANFLSTEYQQELDKGEGLHARALKHLDQNGIVNQKNADDAFTTVYPEYSKGSFSVTTVTNPFVTKYAPGICGTIEAGLDGDSLSAARNLLLNTSSVGAYISSKEAGAPAVEFPLWDEEMEISWARMLRDNTDNDLLGHLLAVSQINSWAIDEDEKAYWLSLKSRMTPASPYTNIAVSLREKFITTEHLFRVLLTFFLLEHAHWINLNQALGWVVGAKRVLLPLAIAARCGWIDPNPLWYRPHTISDKGKQLLLHLIGLRGDNSVLPISAFQIADEKLEENAELPEWLRNMELAQLTAQIIEGPERTIDEHEVDQYAQGSAEELEPLIKASQTKRIEDILSSL